MPEPFEERRLAENRRRETESYGNKTGFPEHKAPEQEAVLQGILLRQDKPVYGESSNTQRNAMESSQKERNEQLNLFDNRILSRETRPQFEIIGQIFETYWLIIYENKLLIVDQHAAHEKVKYERLMKQFREKNVLSQTLNPPTILTLNNREKECLAAHREDFAALGFVMEEFGGSDYAIRGVPMDLYGYGEGEFFCEVLDELADEAVSGTPESIRIRIATMACKAAVKGNMRISQAEMESLLDELLTLENPYNCPHGRPTMISMSKQELERKFKRIV